MTNKKASQEVRKAALEQRFKSGAGRCMRPRQHRRLVRRTSDGTVQCRQQRLYRILRRVKLECRLDRITDSLAARFDHLENIAGKGESSDIGRGRQIVAELRSIRALQRLDRIARRQRFQRRLPRISVSHRQRHRNAAPRPEQQRVLADGHHRVFRPDFLDRLDELDLARFAQSAGRNRRDKPPPGAGDFGVGLTVSSLHHHHARHQRLRGRQMLGNVGFVDCGQTCVHFKLQRK